MRRVVSNAGVLQRAQKIMTMANTAVRHGTTLKIRLLTNHEQLGTKGDVVKVKAGYARNCLIPKGVATYISPTEIKMMAAAAAPSRKQAVVETAAEAAETSEEVAPAH
jgi:ribosomal protein L9